jgi:DNA-binding CsgD family transcriptional regulator
MARDDGKAVLTRDAGGGAGDAWHAALARCLARIGDEGFGDRLAEALATLVHYDVIMVFAYLPGRRPVAPYTNLGRGSAEIIVDDYLAGPFLMDPFYKAACDGRAEGLLRLCEEAPDRFFDSEYYKAHYVRTGIKDELGTLVRLDSGVTVILSLTRGRAQSAFSAHDLRRLARVDPVVREVMRQHWRGLPTRFRAEGADERDALDRAFLRFGGSVLSYREAEIISHILSGHSSESIALRLGITTGTVKIHRRNAYARLGVSSQAELFHAFLRWMHGEGGALAGQAIGGPSEGAP